MSEWAVFNQCKTILTFSNTRCRLPEGHEGDHAGKMTDMELRSATPEELAAQRESYGKNYRPGPRQATPFMPEAATGPAFHAKVNPRIVDRVWIASYTASEYAGVLSRGLFFRSIHDTKEDAEKMAHDPRSADFTVTEYVRVPEERTAEMEQLMASLRAAAQRAMPGTWGYTEDKDGTDKEFRVKRRLFKVGEAFGQRKGIAFVFGDCDANASHISLASPENILKLLDHIEGKAKADEVKE